MEHLSYLNTTIFPLIKLGCLQCRL